MYKKPILNLDARGGLGVINLSDLPFEPKRFFWIFNTPPNTPRAGHGHRSCQQYLMVQSAEVSIKVTSPLLDVSEILLKPGDAFHLPTHHWLELLNFAPGAVLGVWASEPYDRNEYIDTYEDFLEICNS